MSNAVFITGAQMGTGYAIAEMYAKNGWDVFISSRSKNKAEVAAKKLREKYGVFSKGYEYLFESEKEIIDIFADIDKEGKFVETVIFNAANMGFDSTNPEKGQDFWNVSKTEFAGVFETNLVGNFMLARQAAKRMCKVRKGAFVFISSNTAYKAIKNRIAYSASKGGIISMAKALAVDLGEYGIRSNVILPGTIKTERWLKMGDKQIVNGKLTPIGDISDFEDIANACWFFGTDVSKSITGAELIVDGGMSCQLFPEIVKNIK